MLMIFRHLAGPEHGPALRLRRPDVPRVPRRQRLRLQAEQQTQVELQRGRHDGRVAAGRRLLRLRERTVSGGPVGGGHGVAEIRLG